MARARSSEPGAHEGDHRGAAAAAPRSAPVDLRSYLEMLEVHQQAEVEELKRLLGLGPAAELGAAQVEAVLTAISDQAALGIEEETYRLLVGVLVEKPDELRRLRASTIAPLEQYDARHDTDLVVTLENFLAHHGSTTDTAEAMGLHRHTVGYRLTRIQEVAGLSPYESEGRERLSLGLKARRILLADADRTQRDGRA